jgi:gliding motility-associated-like protein
MKRGGLFIIIFACHLCANGQGEANIWYFGNKIGLDFNENMLPKVLTSGAMFTNEGCASISNRKGQVLMYTDGINIWDRRHQVMPNATNLGGHPSSSQSGVIVPYPGDTNKYYVFSVDYEGAPGGVQYALVDMRLNNGFGDIVPGMKNRPLLRPATEKLTAVKHADGRSYWVLAHDIGSSKFYCWKITPDGLQTNPVISAVGSAHTTGGGAIGYMKLNAQGTKLAVCVWADGYFEVFDFNNGTGKVSNPLKVVLEEHTAYGCEFSPNGRYLYIGENATGKVCQYDITKNTAGSLADSRITVGESTTGRTGALQLAPDGRIYVCTPSNYISIIREPDEYGMACEYDEKYIYINGKVHLGLPTFIQSYFGQRDTIYNTNACLPEATEFSCRTIMRAVKYLWDFGDPASDHNQSVLANPTHVYTSPGLWPVTLTVWDVTGASYVISKKVRVHKKLTGNLPKKIIACKGDPVTLDAGNPDAKFEWSSGDTARSINVTHSGLYAVTVRNLNCWRRDSTEVLFIDKMMLDLPDVIYTCRDAPVILSTGVNDLTYRWSTGDTTQQIIVTRPGTYILSAGIGSCITKDSTVVALFPDRGIQGEREPSLCRDSVVFLTAGAGADYHWWPNGESTKTISVRSIGAYSVSFTNPDGCEEIDTVRVTRFCDPLLFIPNAFTPNKKEGNEFFAAKGAGIAEFEMVIFNRWGERVFYSTNMSTGWDGNIRGNPAPEGVYFYRVNYKGTYSIPQSKSGTVTLMK